MGQQLCLVTPTEMIWHDNVCHPLVPLEPRAKRHETQMCHLVALSVTPLRHVD